MPRRLILDLHAERAADELAGHGLSESDAVEVWLGEPAFFRDKVDGRTMMIGPNLGGRLTTIVIEPTSGGELGEWDVVTGWTSGPAEETKWHQAK